MGRIGRAMVLAVYYGVARYLPRSYWPGGGLGTALRMACARRLCAHVGAGSVIEPNVEFGSGRGLSLGDRSGIGPRSVIGTLTVGDDVMIGPELLVVTRNHRFGQGEQAAKYQGYAEDEPCSIGDGAWIGARVTLLPGVRVGAGSVIGAGSVVTHDVPDGCVAAGNPARVVRRIGEEPTLP